MPTRWADEPYSLIPTLPWSQDRSHAAYHIATMMVLGHNSMIRGLNSIYLQAPNVNNPQDIEDFLTYCQCWCEVLHHHHDTEEEAFFPELEAALGIKGLMDENVEQHRVFTPGFEKFEQYVRGSKVEEYDGKELKTLIESFAEPLMKHLSDEIITLRGLDEYDSKIVGQVFESFEKVAQNIDKYRVAPFVFGTSDRDFEGGIHNFPPAPFFVDYIVHYIYGRRHRGAWRFSPCTMFRRRRELAFVESEE